jgi:hypothetical protein
MLWGGMFWQGERKKHRKNRKGGAFILVIVGAIVKRMAPTLAQDRPADHM